MLSNSIKDFTRNVHHDLEKTLIARIKGITTIEGYVKLLAMMYGFYEPVEKVIDKHITTDDIPHYALRRKAGALLDDIRIFVPGYQPPPLATELPFVNSYTTALGSMYVMEGSTLGGKIISGMVQKQLQLQHGAGTSFFNSYGNEADKMWQTFRDKLDEPFSDADKNAILTAAENTFKTFKIWVEQNG